jgi:soluble lytic murein transglycosylase-like protein
MPLGRRLRSTAAGAAVLAVGMIPPTHPGDGARAQAQAVATRRPTVPAPPREPADSGSRYEVRRGDSLWRIARLHNVQQSDLARLNHLEAPYRISEGERLRIPRQVDTGTTEAPAAIAAQPEREALAPVFDRWAGAHSVPPDLLKAVAWEESRWSPDAVSRRGAVGVGQLLPWVADWVDGELIGTELDVQNPEQNIRMSSRYLGWLLQETRGDEAAALAAYHQGLPSVRRKGWYQQTTSYVSEVFRVRTEFR